MAQKGETLVEVKDLCKNFGVTIALSHVDFVVKTGEIRGLIGENGSGKSTVSSIIAGMQPASSGEMFYKGKPWKPATMLEAQKAGIGMIVQEAGTIANISVAENIFLGNYDKFKKGPIINKVAMISEARKALEKIGVTNINPALPARHYDMQERKLIEIAKCMYNDPELLIVDETTTALSQSGRDIIYRIMHEMADAGKAVMIISHDLNEMMEQCSTLTVLRDGVIIDNIEKENFDPDDIKQKMVGREIKGHYYRVDNDGYSDEVVMKADCITTMESLLCFDLDLHKQEILGIGGLSDCGMHTLGRALYGLDEIVDGEVVLPKTGVKIKNAQVAFRNSMGYVSKKRDTESLELNASIFANIASTGYDKNNIGPFILPWKEKAYVDKQIKALQIKCQNAYQPVRALSGGNKQKVVFGNTQHPELLTTDYTNFAGCIGANNAQVGSLFGDWLEENASEDGSEGFLISTSLAAQGNTQHVEITRAILEGLQQKYGITYTKSIDDLIASSETTNVENDKNILITLYPGSPNKDTWLPGISTLLQTGNYKMFLSSGQTYNQSATVVDEVEKSFGINIKVASVGALGTTLETAFNTKDSSGNSSVDLVAIKTVSTQTAAMFAATYNALVSGAECRACRGEDGLPVYFTFNFIPITSAEQLTEMSGWDAKETGNWIANKDFVDQMLVTVNPDVTSEVHHLPPGRNPQPAV
ncbi:MAG: ATP-binding cassette domain-containing protein [Subdoligranulum sp.]|nr:ATP-binding cassette domain-containing protein [Subdoligranulum sp.]